MLELIEIQLQKCISLPSSRLVKNGGRSEYVRGRAGEVWEASSGISYGVVIVPLEQYGARKINAILVHFQLTSSVFSLISWVDARTIAE
jgi:hypothetical protein